MRWRKSPQSIVLGIALMLSVAVLPTLSGCVNDPRSPLSNVLGALGSGSDLPDEAAAEFARFEKVFAEKARDEDGDKLDYVRFAYKEMRTKYVNEFSDADVINAAIKGIEELASETETGSRPSLVETSLDAMTAALDPHTAYLNNEEFNESFVQTRGEFGGLGIEVTMQDGYVKVVSPIEDTPASKANIQPGDLITHVDKDPIKGKSLAQAVRQMRGRAGTDIELRIRRDGVADFDVFLTRAIIKVRAVRWRMEGDIGYVRVSRFSERMEGGVIKAFAALRAEHGKEPRGFVLDLRNNPGGLLNQSVILSDAFLNAGEIVSVRGRSYRSSSVFTAEDGDIANGTPMVVLINGGSASASEIVASALKFHKRATVMGTQSFGKGSVQTIIPLPIEGGLKLTTALYYGPDGHTLQARGVTPDIVLKPVLNPELPKAENRTESSLPGALPAEDDSSEIRLSEVSVETCSEIGEAKDRELGCAVALLQAGSTAKFLASRSLAKTM